VLTDTLETAGLLAAYRQAVANGELQQDSWQLAAINELQRVSDEVVARERARKSGFLNSLLAPYFLSRPSPVRGLYLWGGVGRGKTLLMDMFFAALTLEKKSRLHFHRFMRMVHERLRLAVGQANPLVEVAAGIARETQVLCFDEFYVSDIGDAMILANLLEALFANGVVLVATSNVPPERLYENGLQRKKFLPAIDLLNRHTAVLNVQGETDYRMLALGQGEAMYHCPPGAESLARMESIFNALSRGQKVLHGEWLEIQGRKVGSRKVTSDVVWFEFSQICQGPRGTADYIELADRFQTVLISGVPVFTSKTDDDARRFIALVDEFYDHRVKLIVEAAASITELYQGEALAFVFERTKSRLIEMQGPDYLAVPRQPD